MISPPKPGKNIRFRFHIIIYGMNILSMRGSIGSKYAKTEIGAKTDNWQKLLQRIKTLIEEQIIFPTHTKPSAITFCQGGEIICLFVK